MSATKNTFLITASTLCHLFFRRVCKQFHRLCTRIGGQNTLPTLPEFEVLHTMRRLLSCLLVAICSLSVTPSFSAPDPRQVRSEKPTPIGEPGGRPRRPPPQAAIEACAGKDVGAPCTVNAPDGVRSGECLSGMENIFACRPHRKETAYEPVQEPAREERAERQPGNRQEVKTPAVTTPTPETKPPVPARVPETAQPTLQPQVPPVLKPESGTEAVAGRFSSLAGTIGAFLVVALCSIALTWYVFFRYSTLPLRRLRKVTQQLAGGDLSARVGEGLLHRKNEVMELGRDVDRMAERIEDLVGAHQRLIRDVSHELRSPLARLNVALELARQSAGPSHSAPFDRIERESDRLNELIGQLLTLTKLESESGMSRKTEVDISGLIAEIALDVDFEAKNSNRRVEIVENTPVSFMGNREMLRQALENVIRNAVRYTAEDTAVEIICRQRKSKERLYGHIEIRDHGPGVPESEIFNIFRPFYRVADARERQSGGTGVGLAISDRAIRLHGGSIRAINATGEGLIVEIELPLDK